MMTSEKVKNQLFSFITPPKFTKPPSISFVGAEASRGGNVIRSKSNQCIVQPLTRKFDLRPSFLVCSKSCPPPLRLNPPFFKNDLFYIRSDPSFFISFQYQGLFQRSEFTHIFLFRKSIIS